MDKYELIKEYIKIYPTLANKNILKNLPTYIKGNIFYLIKKYKNKASGQTANKHLSYMLIEADLALLKIKGGYGLYISINPP